MSKFLIILGTLPNNVINWRLNVNNNYDAGGIIVIRWRTVIPLVAILTLNLLAFVPTATAQEGPVMKVAVAITPFGALVDEVGGDLVETTTLLPEGVEPHSFTATPQIIQAAEEADLLVFSGHFPWEQDIAEQTNTPFITIDDYETYGAALSPFPGKNDSSTENPHGYWLLPRNAIAIANATRAKLTEMQPAYSDQWNASFDNFVGRVNGLKEFINATTVENNIIDMHAVVVFPAEAYIAEAFGIHVDAVLQEGENIFISGSKLLAIQEALQNGSISVILGSDVGDLQAGGEFADQLAQDTGATIIWWRAVFTGTADYVTLLSYDLGLLVEGLDNAQSGTDNTTFLIVLVFAGAMAVVSVVEAIILVQRAREE